MANPIKLYAETRKAITAAREDVWENLYATRESSPRYAQFVAFIRACDRILGENSAEVLTARGRRKYQ